MNTVLKPTIKKVGDIYVLPRGDKLSCQEMAELEIEVIAHIQNQINRQVMHGKRSGCKRSCAT
jgi:hypothetical protein